LVVVLGVSGSVSFHAAATDTTASRDRRSLQARDGLYAPCHIYCSQMKSFLGMLVWCPFLLGGLR